MKIAAMTMFLVFLEILFILMVLILVWYCDDTCNDTCDGIVTGDHAVIVLVMVLT